MQADVLTLPTLETADAAQDAWRALRTLLGVSLVVVGVLLTLWILLQLGPVAYGLPAPFFRRASLGA